MYIIHASDMVIYSCFTWLYLLKMLIFQFWSPHRRTTRWTTQLSTPNTPSSDDVSASPPDLTGAQRGNWADDQIPKHPFDPYGIEMNYMDILTMGIYGKWYPYSDFSSHYSFYIPVGTIFYEEYPWDWWMNSNPIFWTIKNLWLFLEENGMRLLFNPVSIPC